MKYFLDTNIVSYYLSGRYPAMVQHFTKIPAQSICIPSIVVAEVEYGAKKSSNYEKTITPYRSFFSAFSEVGFSHDAALVYGEIRADLARKGTPIGGNDLLIAATVISEGGILVTNNVDEFERIPELAIENWTK